MKPLFINVGGQYINFTKVTSFSKRESGGYVDIFLENGARACIPTEQPESLIFQIMQHLS